MESIRVLLADDHDIVRFGISSVLQTAEDIEIVAEAASGAKTLEWYKEVNPEVSIIDISMPHMNGIETSRRILEYDPQAKILILTMHMNENYLNQVLRIGVLGYLLKNSAKKELLEGVRKVAEGKNVFSESVAKLMTEHYINRTRSEEDAQQQSASITSREQEILKLIAAGLTSQEIADKLKATEEQRQQEIDEFITPIKQKLEENNRKSELSRLIINKKEIVLLLC